MEKLIYLFGLSFFGFLNLHSLQYNVALAEELGHYHKSCGDVLNQSTVANRKSENAGRAWAYKRLAPPEKIRACLRKGYFSFHDIAEELDVTTEFLVEAMAYYQQKGVTLNTAEAEDVDAVEIPSGFTLIPRCAKRLTNLQKRRFYDVLNRTVDLVLSQESAAEVGRIRKD